MSVLLEELRQLEGWWAAGREYRRELRPIVLHLSLSELDYVVRALEAQERATPEPT